MLEQFLAMLKSIKVDHDVKKMRNKTRVQVENSEGAGYPGFCSVWIFDKNGNLVDVSHWE